MWSRSFRPRGRTEYCARSAYVAYSMVWRLCWSAGRVTTRCRRRLPSRQRSVASCRGVRPARVAHRGQPRPWPHRRAMSPADRHPGRTRRGCEGPASHRTQVDLIRPRRPGTPRNPWLSSPGTLRAAPPVRVFARCTIGLLSPEPAPLALVGHAGNGLRVPHRLREDLVVCLDRGADCNDVSYA